MASNYAHDASRVMFTVDGATAGLLSKVSGGLHMKGNLAEAQSATSKFGIKTTNMISTEEITCEIATSQCQGILDWANSFVDSVHLRKDCQVLFGNSKNEVTAGVDLVDCLMTSFSLGALDAAGKDYHKITFKLRPTKVVPIKAGGKMDGVIKAEQKDFMNNAFKGEVGPLPMTGLKKVDALTWEMKVQEMRTGPSRLAQIIPTVVNLPKIKLTIDSALEDALSAWEDWHEDFAVVGNSGSAKEHPGAFTWLGSDNVKELFTVEFKQAGIYEFTRGDREAGKDAVHEFTASLYAESFDLRKLGA